MSFIFRIVLPGSVARALIAVVLVTVSVLMLGSGLYPAAGHVGRGAPDLMTALSRPSPLGTGLHVEAIGNASPAPPLGVVATIPLQWNPAAPVYDPLTGDVYIVNSDGNVSVLNGSTLIGNLSLSHPASSITVDPENGFLYVMSVIPCVEVVSGGRQIATIPTNVGPSGLFDARNGYIYVASNNTTNPYGQYGLVIVLEGTSVLASFTVGTEADLLTYDGQTGDVYLASGGENVTVLNGTSVVSTISLGIAPDDAVYDAEDGYVYFAGPSESIVVLQGTSVVGAIAYTLAPREYGLGPVDPRTGDLYVNLIINVSVVWGTSILATFPIFRAPYVFEIEDEAIYDSLRGVVEVVDNEPTVGGSEPDEVQLFNGTETMGNISLGVTGDSTGAAYDPARGDTYVTTGPGCLISSCYSTQKPGYVVILGSPPQNSGISGWTYAVIGGVVGGIAVATIALVLWSRRRRPSSLR